MKRRKRLTFVLVILLVSISIFYVQDSFRIGNELDNHKGVAVYYNGIVYIQSHGKNYSESNYYYGYKWQCVEYVKRFFYQAKGHEMPDVFGNARDYFDPSVEQGQLNESRGLIQYRNGGDVSPQPDDLLVFVDTHYGHAAIITDVSESYIEVIQQNVPGKIRDRLPLQIVDGKYNIGASRKPAGWLRLE